MLPKCFEYKSGAHSIENLLLNNKSLTQNKKTTNAKPSYQCNCCYSKHAQILFMQRHFNTQSSKMIIIQTQSTKI